MASNAGANSALKVCLLKFQTSGRSISHRHGFWCTLINGKQPVRSDSGRHAGMASMQLIYLYSQVCIPEPYRMKCSGSQ